MKKIVSLLLTFLLVLCVLLNLSFNVSAASTEVQDGLEVVITTDKPEYSAGEDILVSVSIKNTNSYKVENTSIETLLPEGLVLKKGSLSETGIDIEAGESYSVSVVAQLFDEAKSDGETKPDDTTNSESIITSGNGQEANFPQTNDNSNTFLWVVLFITSAVAIILIFKNKKIIQILSLFLCFTMVLSMLPVSTLAARDDAVTITVDKTITVDSKIYIIKINFTYSEIASVLQPVIELQCNSSLIYDSNNDRYILLEKLDVLFGTMSNSNNIINSCFKLLFNENVVTTYSFMPGESWCVQNFALLPGENVLKFYMTDVNGDIWEQNIVIFCSKENNTEAIIGDTTSDKDSDNLPNYIEELFGTNPNSNDTDGDGLPDGVEANILGCDARKIDTDGDGISDGDEDADEDGLSNYEEIEKKTDPCNYDTDNDLLSDYQEIYFYHTSPLKMDTDGDGLADGWEIEHGKDPLVAEKIVSISDSMPSGESTAEVILDLPSEIAQSFVMSAAEEEILSTNIPGQLSTPISLEIEGILPENGATLRFFVPNNYPNEVTKDFIPVIYYYNPITQMLEEVSTTYNNHIAEAQLEHFSTYILLNKKAFDEVWETEIRIPGDYEQDHPDRLDVVLVIDSSGSMTSNDRNNIRLEAAKQFVDKLGEKDRAAVIDFDNSTKILCEFTNNKNTLHTAINNVNSSGGTSLTKGISPAIDLFTNETYSNEAYRYIIMLTDGDGSYNTALTSKAKENNIQIYTIGLGSGVKTSTLKAIAEGTDGKYYFASAADQLIQIYEDTAMETIDYSTDSNNDGITDYYTRLIAEGKLRDGVGNRYFAGAITQEVLNSLPDNTSISELIYQSIQSNDDFDGDGKKNGEELIISQNGDTVYIKMVSNPMYKNSDSDPFEDGLEINLGGHPFEYDIQKMDLSWLTNDELYPAALSAERYVNNGWYRFQLGLGNYVYGGEYDWCYAAQKQLLESTEVYAQNLIESYKAIYLSENFITLINNFLSEVNNVLSTYNNITSPVSDAHTIREIMGYMVKLTEAQKELSKMDLSNLGLVVNKCEEISKLYSKIDSSTAKLSEVDFTEYTSLTKLSLKVPSWVTKVSSGIGKISTGLTYFTATVDTIDNIGSTISGYGALTATSQYYGVMYDVLCNLHTNSDINFVSIAAGKLKASMELQYAQMISEAHLVLKDVVYNWDEVAIDAVLVKCGPVGWAIGLGRGLANLISGVGNTCKKHIYMITAGEAGKASAKLLDSSLDEKGNFYCKASNTTLDFMLLCGTLRIVGEKGMIDSSNAQSWLFKWINNHNDVESFCNEQIKRVVDILSNYALKVNAKTI